MEHLPFQLNIANNVYVVVDVFVDPLRAIVLRDACLVYVPDGADSLISMLKQDFLTNARDNAESPFEFRYVVAVQSNIGRVGLTVLG